MREFIAYVIGVVGGGLVSLMLCANAYSKLEAKHRDAVFMEQVQRHECKITSRIVDGEEVKNGLCILPDGTVIQR